MRVHQRVLHDGLHHNAHGGQSHADRHPKYDPRQADIPDDVVDSPLRQRCGVSDVEPFKRGMTSHTWRTVRSGDPTVTEKSTAPNTRKK